MRDHVEKTRTVAQRAEHVRRWLSELECWRWREAVPLERWRFAAGVGGEERVITVGREERVITVGREERVIELGREERPMAVGDPWPSREGVAVFTYGDVRVPEGWPLDEARLVLDLGGEARVFLGDGDRVRTCGADPYHRVLPVEARAFTLRAEAVARDLFGAPQRDARLRTAFLGRREPALEAFLCELRVLHDGVLALADHEAAPALLELAEVALAGLPWPTETIPFLERIADHPEQRSIWDRLVEPPAAPRPLADAHRAALEAATARLREGIAGLARRWPKVGRVAVTGHAHIDYVWLWPQPETVRKALRTFGTQAMLLGRHPGYRFAQSQACLYAHVEESDPALFAEVKAWVEEGRWEPVGGMWVECDTSMPSAEAFNRQLLYGQRWFQERLGVRSRVAWLPDTFGFTAALPPLLRAAGLEAMLTIKVTWNETNSLSDNVFRWEGVDGSSVLVHTFEAGPWGAYNMDLSPRAVHGVWRAFKNKTLHDETLASFGWGDGGGGPAEEQLERIEAINRLPVVPEVRPTRVDAFFERLGRAVEGATAVPVWRGELYLEYHRATLTTQGRTKRRMRWGEAALAAAEILEGLAWLAGEGGGGDHADAWKLLLRNQFHDALPGSSIREVYAQTERELGEVLAGADAACGRALGALARRLGHDAGAGRGTSGPALLLANTAGSPAPCLRHAFTDGERSAAEALGAQPAAGGGWVLSAPLPTPPLAVRLVARPPPPGPLSADERRLENAYVRVAFDGAGRIASLWDKRRGREALAGPANQLWAYKDRPRAWDAWDLEASFALGGAELTEVEELALTERGPHRAELRVARRFGERSRIVQRYRLWADSARLDVATRIELGDRRTYLRALFPLAVHADHATFDQALGVVTRPTHDNTSWQRAQFEGAAHRFADLSETDFGVALLNDGKYGHSAKGNVLTLSLVRGPTYPDPLADEGVQEFTYALLPHGGRWWDDEVQGEADDLALAVRAMPVPAAGAVPAAAGAGAAADAEGLWRPVAWSGAGVRVLAFKRAEDGRGRVLRVAEARGARGTLELRLPEGFACVEEVGTLEEGRGPPAYELTPFQMRAWRVERR